MTNSTLSPAGDQGPGTPVRDATIAACDISSLQGMPKESIDAVVANASIKLFFRMDNSERDA